MHSSLGKTWKRTKEQIQWICKKENFIYNHTFISREDSVNIQLVRDSLSIFALFCLFFTKLKLLILRKTRLIKGREFCVRDWDANYSCYGYVAFCEGALCFLLLKVGRKEEGQYSYYVYVTFRISLLSKLGVLSLHKSETLLRYVIMLLTRVY